LFLRSYWLLLPLGSVGVHHIIPCTFPSISFSSWFLLCSYVLNPVLVIIDVQPKELGIPTKAYYAVEEVKEVSVVLEVGSLCYLVHHLNIHCCPSQNATQKSQKVFVHVPSEIAAHEVEEIGMMA
jgi:hypothetical protein